MDEIGTIVTALAAGAASGVSGTASEAVKDCYEMLKALIRGRFDGRDRARGALDAAETDPGVWRARIGDDLRTSGAAADERVLAVARDLLAAADPGRPHIVVGINHGAIGQFSGPVSFDQRTQLPPTSPAAD